MLPKINSAQGDTFARVVTGCYAEIADLPRGPDSLYQGLIKCSLLESASYTTSSAAVQLWDCR